MRCRGEGVYEVTRGGVGNKTRRNWKRYKRDVNDGEEEKVREVV